MKLTGGPAGYLEAIRIGDKHYWNSGGKWTLQTGGSSAAEENGGVVYANEVADMLKDVKYVGREAVNGVACHAYTYTFEIPEAKQSGRTKVWIGVRDGLPRQSDSEYKGGDAANKTHTVYEYGVNIRIESPAM
jgi:hypothetical protein